jgi:glycosyltransferase involved in cell wall biosynthesis
VTAEINQNTHASVFRKGLHDEFEAFLGQESTRYPLHDCLRIDLHCHDSNSDVPDELWGRILRLPESWLKTRNLIKCLEDNNCNVFTITNHNNARSCWDLNDRGQDVLVGAEFTCYFPEYNLFVHVLTYGFDTQQEQKLNEYRSDIYTFLRYTHTQNIPVILPHPLYFYTRNDKIDLSLFEKMAVLFQNFEIVNGQRDKWQSVLTLNWIKSLNAEKIRSYASKHNLKPEDYGVDPDKPKVLTGGSDDHMGIFAGQSGSYLYVPDLAERLKKTPASTLALEALREGRIAPYGHVLENQKLNIALLDYFSQVATQLDDPGLLRILFHRGEVSDKIACFMISNLLLEMQKHKNTQKFFKFVHNAIHGKKPNKLVKWKIKKDYSFCITSLEKIALSKTQSPEHFIETVNQSIGELFTGLSLLMIKRLKKSSSMISSKKLKTLSTQELTRNFEIPSQLTEMFFGSQCRKKNMSGFNISQLLDNLSFPVLVSVILLGTTLASTRLLYQNRRFLNEFSCHIGKGSHPKRALYLTDTLRDKNGVSSSLWGKLKEVQRMDLPIDFLTCHSDLANDSHLIVTRPLSTFELPEFGGQEIRIPDLMEICRIFYEGGYDRIVCSTEGPMAFVSLFIKHMFNVPAYFFMHTDWLEFIKNTTDINRHERDRLRRMLRFFYKQYAAVFVLNDDHKDWLTGHEMQLHEDAVLLTAHHAQAVIKAITKVSKAQLFDDASADTPVLFFASRLSREKGIFDLPEIFRLVRAAIPDIRLVIAGSGPAEEELKECLPEARYLGWVDKKSIAELYAGLDLKIFPSRFDTFGNVLLESFSYGMPAVAYNCKGPKNIIQHGVSGFLVEDKAEMADRIIHYFSHADLRKKMKKAAVQRSQQYEPGAIMQKFIRDLGLVEPATDDSREVKNMYAVTA